MRSKTIMEYTRVYSGAMVKEFGYDAVVFLDELKYWVMHSPYEYNGHKWVFNATDSWSKQLNLRVSTICQCIQKFVKLGVIMFDGYNSEHPEYERWYTIDENKLETLEAAIEKKYSSAKDRIGIQEWLVFFN